MKSMRLDREAHTIEAIAVEHMTVEPADTARTDALVNARVDAHAGGKGPRWPIPPTRGEAASLGARLSELLSQETPEALLDRLAEFKHSVEEALRRSSSAFHILRQLEESGLKDCARCTRELEARLAGNPHYLVLGKIAEAEKLISELRAVRL